MGAWGTGPLENDAAGDFVNSLGRSFKESSQILEKALTVKNYEFDEADEQVAAVAVVAALVQYCRGQPLEDEFSVIKWADELDTPTLEQWRKLALNALDDLKSPDNELMELWREAGEEETWRAELTKLRQTLL